MWVRHAAVFSLALVLASSCEHHRTRHTSATAAPSIPSGPADIPRMRALLDRYSPNGRYIVATFEALPRQFVIGDTTTTLSYAKGFADYFRTGAPEDLVDYMGIAVHEVYHAYSDAMAYQLRAERQLPRGLGAEVVYVDGAPILVSYSPSFPARELDATFPATARTSRYPIYVFPSERSQSTQLEGVFGLLDELTAYLHQARTLVDFWPWIRDESPVNEQLLVNYVARFHEMWEPYAEFKLFILDYVRFARDHHPEIYRALLANQGFRRAFAAVDAAYAALLANAATLEPTIHAFARSRGVDADLRDGQLTFDGRLFKIRSAAYPALLEQLASPAYQETLGMLR